MNGAEATIMESYSMEKEMALVEAVIYLENEPASEELIARVTGLAPDIAAEAIERLQSRYSAEDSGLELIHVSGGWMLSPKKELWEQLKGRYGKKSEGRLSRAAMETLSIIAYSQPITRAEIEAIRGSNPDNMIRLLTERGLIKAVGKKDVPGKPVQFGTTQGFLKAFKINSIADLPKLEESESRRFELSR